MWNLPPPPGFQGLRDSLPLHRYARNLPHWRQEGATYFVTFRLADSLPVARLHELAGLRNEWERRHPPPRTGQVGEEWQRIEWVKTEQWLDAGEGECLLRAPEHWAEVQDSLHHFAEPAGSARYELGAYVVMPNHAHAIVRPLEPARWPLEAIVGGWKRHSSHRIHEVLGRQGRLWQEESFDRIVRDEEHLWRSLQYIGRNPIKASLRSGEFALWVSPAWEELGWTFERHASP